MLHQIKHALVAACAIALATPALALDVDITPTPEVGVEKTYTITVKNDGSSFADDIDAEDIFGYAITLDSMPMAEYYAFFVSGDQYDSDGVTVYVRSMLDFNLHRVVTIPSLGGGSKSQYSLIGLAIDPTTGLVYTLYDDGGTCERCLYTINLNTGAATLVANLDFFYSGLAFDSTGQLWGLEGCNEGCDGAMFKINKATGAQTTSIADSAGSNYEHSIAFNPDDGMMYYFANNEIYKFSTATPAAPTLVSDETTIYGAGSVYIGDDTFIYHSYYDEGGFFQYNKATNSHMLLTDSTVDDSIDSVKGILASGHYQNALECTGSGDDMVCVVPRLIPGGEVKLTVTGTLYEAPEDTTDTTDDDDTDDSDDDVTDTTDDVTDTTDDDEEGGSGGCSVAGNGTGFGHDLLLLALAAGAVLAWRRRLA